MITKGVAPVIQAHYKHSKVKHFELRRANEILKSASVFFATQLDADRTR